ncbi:Gfo/Idh/MocA family protein [Paracoccus seriniphilus]|uniref:Predicted dehydrogenase n=1 Tax=Paracoccus seriniphilus TaxID=184748 RepID=A0A239PTY8_9RHOB|nr:Gfo/Idh/MocA family oxidoreductase [Paracoccus seriniphilus]WCR16556.1 Gfo/Idh/MocA family oxidoreductase [Paracoccus seriniphilus]SNT73771.1 Predicted dehydrogenase [Paracoccus seriniphilus]
MTEKPIANLAVIGLGMATKPHLEALAELKGRVNVSGVFNRSPAKAEAVSKTFGFPVFDSLAAIAADPGTDGVIIATPPNQRAAILSEMASAGKDILMEKPVERSLKAAQDIVAECEAKGVTLGIVFQHRMRKGALRLRELVDQGELGDLALVRAEIPWWRDQSYYDVPGRGTFERDGGGVLISQAIHVLDLMLSLTGPARRVQAFTATTAQHDMEAEDFATAGIRFDNGAVGSVVATTATYPGEEERLVLDGTRGTAVLTGGKLVVTWRDGRRETVGEVSGTGGGADPMAFPCDWHRELIEDFARAIRDKRPPRITGREALRVHALIDAMTRSGASGTTVEIGE